MTARPVVAAALAAVLVLAGCASDDGGRDQASGTVTTTIPTGPAGDAFYTPPTPLPRGKPGDVLRARPVKAPAGTKGWRILYLSTTVQDAPVAVSGLLFAPDPLPAGQPLPVLAVAHGTTGLGDQCAPSRLAETEENSVEIAGLPSEVTSRYVVVVTDYEGLGTPGVHPYVVGLSEGRNVLDSIRAAQRFPGAGTTSASKSVTWGHSQGGGAALFTGELASTYAPDANLAGVAAGAPASELKLLGTALRTSPFFGYVFMAAAGFHAAYPDLDLSTVFTPAGIEAVQRAGEQCGSETVDAYRGKDPNLYLKVDPGTTEPFASLLEENSPGVRRATVPVFLYQGEADEQIPVVASKLVMDRYCKNGTTVSRKTWPGASHSGVVPLALPDIEQFLADRLAGTPAPSSC